MDSSVFPGRDDTGILHVAMDPVDKQSGTERERIIESSRNYCGGEELDVLQGMKPFPAHDPHGDRGTPGVILSHRYILISTKKYRTQYWIYSC